RLGAMGLPPQGPPEATDGTLAPPAYSGAGRIRQPLEARGHKAGTPLTDRGRGHAQAGGHGRVGLPRCTGQNDPRPLRQGLSGARPATALFEGVTFRQGRRSGVRGRPVRIRNLLSAPELNATT
ncbi:MAG: hypothetical protein C4294_09940, partial [Nitrospiraceae bacterium]